MPVKNNDDKIISLDEIKKMLNEIVLASKTKNFYPINICSSDNRDIWADVYNRTKGLIIVLNII